MTTANRPNSEELFSVTWRTGEKGTRGKKVIKVQFLLHFYWFEKDDILVS